ncbi:MarR family winged helix-turn-helix transcriptional regulator [Bacillus massiliigorillae]|uniref:MarR family winged helix-turn-helix transcriptional regulator n=1 Tax=Bacillus massiliigorillae TaxID=1243664 RepID=UPI0003A4BC15|nr:MarR family transcriptional regulator [Bacillus massiliigorillae]
MDSRITEHIGVLIHTVDLEITNYLKNRLGILQLAPEQHLVMALLLREEGLSQNEIAKQLNKDKSSITRMLLSLEKKGFIYRKPCSQDQRSVKVFLSDEGRALNDEIEYISNTTKNLLSEGFTEEESVELKRLLLKVRQNVRQS